MPQWGPCTAPHTGQSTGRESWRTVSSFLGCFMIKKVDAERKANSRASSLPKTQGVLSEKAGFPKVSVVNLCAITCHNSEHQWASWREAKLNLDKRQGRVLSNEPESDWTLGFLYRRMLPLLLAIPAPLVLLLHICTSTLHPNTLTVHPPWVSPPAVPNPPRLTLSLASHGLCNLYHSTQYSVDAVWRSF